MKMKNVLLITLLIMMFMTSTACAWDHTFGEYEFEGDISPEEMTDDLSYVLSFDISNDGQYLYVAEYTTNGNITQYHMSTPWKLSTATYTGKYTQIEARAHDMRISPDGTKIWYTYESSDETIREYTLDTPYDISTASTSPTTSVNLEDIDYISGYVTGFAFSEYGNYLMVTGDGDEVVYFQMSVPYDIGTIFESNDFCWRTSSVDGEDVSGIEINYDTNTTYLTKKDLDKILTYSFSTYEDNYLDDSTDPALILDDQSELYHEIKDLRFSSDGKHFYIHDYYKSKQYTGYGPIKHYAISDPWASVFDTKYYMVPGIDMETISDGEHTLYGSIEIQTKMGTDVEWSRDGTYVTTTSGTNHTYTATIDDVGIHTISATTGGETQSTTIQCMEDRVHEIPYTEETYDGDLVFVADTGHMYGDTVMIVDDPYGTPHAEYNTSWDGHFEISGVNPYGDPRDNIIFAHAATGNQLIPQGEAHFRFIAQQAVENYNMVNPKLYVAPYGMANSPTDEIFPRTEHIAHTTPEEGTYNTSCMETTIFTAEQVLYPDTYPEEWNMNENCTWTWYMDGEEVSYTNLYEYMEPMEFGTHTLEIEGRKNGIPHIKTWELNVEDISTPPEITSDTIHYIYDGNIIEFESTQPTDWMFSYESESYETDTGTYQTAFDPGILQKHGLVEFTVQCENRRGKDEQVINVFIPEEVGYSPSNSIDINPLDTDKIMNGDGHEIFGEITKPYTSSGIPLSALIVSILVVFATAMYGEQKSTVPLIVVFLTLAGSILYSLPIPQYITTPLFAIVAIIAGAILILPFKDR